MLYIGIDVHKRYLTISMRDEQGNVLVRRSVQTTWGHVERFLEDLQERAADQGGYVVMLEVCGFEHWLVRQLERHGCHGVHVVAPKERVRQKTDRRDAAKLSELLWINHHRIAAGERLIDVKEVYQPTDDERHDRQLTRLRYRLGQQLTRVKNGIKKILTRHNLHQDCPTKGVFTRKSMRWLRELTLPEIDRMELNMLLVQYTLYTSQIDRAEAAIHERARRIQSLPLLRTVGSMGDYTALAISAHIGSVDRFKHAKSLANFYGVTPGSRNSGGIERLGHITKAGHPFVRFLLGQQVLHALRKDPGLRQWYRRIKQRRGSQTARTAVMRRLCEGIWHVLSKNEPYRPVGSGRVTERDASPGRGRRATRSFRTTPNRVMA